MRTSAGKIIYQAAVYRCWFEWLRASEKYVETCEAKGRIGTQKMREIYEDWGDIRDVRFSTWFAANRIKLFAEPRVEGVSLLEVGERAPKGAVSISIPFGLERAIVLRRITRLISTRFPAAKGWQSKHSKARYPITRKPNTFSLRRTLKVYELSKKEPDIKLREIAARVGITGDTINQVVQVVQIKKRALEIMSAVEAGQFPKRTSAAR
jgi:hypothetical protein